MTDHIASTDANEQNPLGIRLQSAREALGIDRKEAASQLRLPENIVSMMENGEQAAHIPLMFMRGYIRSYGKFLNIPEQDIKDALTLMQPPQPEPDASEKITTAPLASNKPLLPMNDLPTSAGIGSFFKKLFTYLIGITVVALAIIWWHSEKTTAVEHTSVVATPVTTPAAPTPVVTTRGMDTTEQYNSKSAASLPPPAMTRPITPSSVVNDYQTIFTQRILNDSYVQIIVVIAIALLIILVTLGLRMALTASSPSTIMTTRPTPLIQNKLFLLILSGIAVTAVIAGVAWFNTYNKKQFVVTKHPITPPTHTVAPPTTINEHIPTEAEIAALPQFNLSAALLDAMKANTLQTLAWQLNDYIHQAADVRFELTGTTGPIFFKKKSHKYHPAYYHKAAVAPILD